MVETARANRNTPASTGALTTSGRSTGGCHAARALITQRATSAPPPNQARVRDAKEIEAAWTPVESFDSEAMALLSSESAAILYDRNDIQTGDRVVLIVEDDISFAGILLDLAREKGFKGLVATSGALALNKNFAEHKS